MVIVRVQCRENPCIYIEEGGGRVKGRSEDTGRYEGKSVLVHVHHTCSVCTVQ